MNWKQETDMVANSTEFGGNWIRNELRYGQQ